MSDTSTDSPVRVAANDAVLDDWDLRRIGRGRVKDGQAPKVAGNRRVVVTGRLRHSEIRVRRGGMAVLVAMCSREFLADLREARRQNRTPTVADPAHTTQP